MKKWFFLSLIFVTLIFTACQKEYDPGPLDNNGNGTDTTGNPGTDSNQTVTTLAGNWNFISLSEQSQVSSEGNIDGVAQKNVYLFNGTSTDSSGVVFFTDAAMSSQNISYTIAGILKNYTYTAGILSDSINTLFSYTLPVSHGTGNYRLIGKDSIYFTGDVFGVPGTNGSVSSVTGGHYALNGNTLKLTSLIDSTYTQDISGITFTNKTQVSSIITLQKQ